MLPRIHGEFGLVTEPEAKFSSAGNLWVSARIVAKDRKRDQSGQWQDGDVCFLNLTVFGKYAENLVESGLSKGDTIIVEGKLQMREWETDQGEKRVTYSVLADTVGPSLLWNPASPVKSRAAGDQQGPFPAQNLAPQAPQDDAPPF